MRLYRCLKCLVGFAIFLKRGKENKGGKGVTCPLCKSGEVEEIDAVKEVGGHLLTKAFEFWKRLPDGD